MLHNSALGQWNNDGKFRWEMLVIVPDVVNVDEVVKKQQDTGQIFIYHKNEKEQIKSDYSFINWALKDVTKAEQSTLSPNPLIVAAVWYSPFPR